MSAPSQTADLALSETEPSKLVFRGAPITDSFYRAQKEGDPPRFKFADHGWLGDGITLTWTDGKQYTAVDKPFILPSLVKATYGQINGLARDFYTTTNPISDSKDLKDQVQRFHTAWNYLSAKSPLLPAEANETLRVLQDEINAVKQGIDNKLDPSTAYSNLNLDQMNKDLQKATSNRPYLQQYLALAFFNWDHFGLDAHTAYIAGHTAALQTAKAGDLITAYSMNAFADHFSEDSFSAGHIRTPRRALHGTVNIFYDLNAKLMHEEDGAIGLKVKNKRGDHWTADGDRRLLDIVGQRNRDLCKEAVQSSANEIYAVWKGGAIPTPDNYAFQNLVPILDHDVVAAQELAALFLATNSNVSRRSNITDRRTAAYTTTWVATTTYWSCEHSEWWKHPITIDGPPK